MTLAEEERRKLGLSRHQRGKRHKKAHVFGRVGDRKRRACHATKDLQGKKGRPPTPSRRESTAAPREKVFTAGGGRVEKRKVIQPKQRRKPPKDDDITFCILYGLGKEVVFSLWSWKEVRARKEGKESALSLPLRS